MNLKHSKIIPVLQKVRAVRAELQVRTVGQLGMKLSVMDLHKVVQDMCGLSIEMLEVSFAGEHLRGKVERYSNNRARVLVRAGMALTETRLVTTKELSHLVIDEEADWSTVGVDTISELLTENIAVVENGEGIADPSVPAQSEMLAQLAASELLYPREYRAADYDRLAKDETSVSKIALEHGVPAYVIEHAHRHRDIFDRVWEKCDAALAAAAE